MGSLSIWHWIIVLAVGLLLFGGRGKISELMGDFAKGIKSFKKGMADDDKPEDDAQGRSEDDRPSAGRRRRHEGARGNREEVRRRHGLTPAAGLPWRPDGRLTASGARAGAISIATKRRRRSRHGRPLELLTQCSTSVGASFFSSASSR